MTRNSTSRPSAAQRTREYIQARPEIMECLRLGIINHRALGREIARASGSRDAATFAVSVSRFTSRLKRTMARSTNIDGVFEKGSLVIRTQVSILTVDGELPGELLVKLKQLLPKRTPVAFVQAEQQSTLVLPDRHVALVTKAWHVRTRVERSGLALLSLTLPEHTVAVRGVLARLTALFASKQVNVIELIGVSGELMLLVEEAELGASIECLKSLGVS